MLRPPSFALLIAALLVAPLVGCGDARQGAAAGRFEPATPGTLTVATAEIPTPGFWEGTAEDPDGGFEYELAQLLRERFELERLEVRVVPFAELIAGDLGGADLALALITPTPERDAVLDFSDPYLTSPPALLTNADLEVPDLETARELRYAVEVGTTLEQELESAIDPLPPVIVAADRDAVLAALVEGDADAAIFDLPAAAALAADSDGEQHVAAKLGTSETIAAALPDGAVTNSEAVSSSIRALNADGTLPELSEAWLGSEVTEGAPTVPLLRADR